MRLIVFGSYDVARHPRVEALVDGLRASGAEVVECNAPLRVNASATLLRRPWQLLRLLLGVARSWLLLIARARRLPRPDAVLVGYLGQADVHLARRLFRGTPLVLDHLISGAAAARARGITRGPARRLLERLDAAALRTADLVLVDTEEHGRMVPQPYRDKVVVVPIGASQAWFSAARPIPDAGADAGGAAGDAAVPAGPEPRLRVVFFGRFAPVQGAPVIGAALGQLRGFPLEVTMLGSGPDEPATRAAIGDAVEVRWLRAVPPGGLPALVAEHDVCLGTFATSAYALRMVPHKVYQGAAAGCAIVTSDTVAQRRAVGEAAVLVPPGDPDALADVLRRLSSDPAETLRLRAAAHRLALRQFTPEHVVAPLMERLPGLLSPAR
jgi:glycosyltransferase involved in cell wall biosynthesis